MAAQLGTAVAVIGGGCAGLAAAARLAEQGLATSLFEASPQLGGRARGVSWKGQRLDNGQHIMLGAYRETLALMALAGVKEKSALLRLPLRLQIDDFSLGAASWLPAPLHILFGLINARGLNWAERTAAIGFMVRLRLSGFRLPNDRPLLGFLQQHKQPANLIRLLWEPLCLAALNTPIAQASAQVFVSVLRDSFARAKSDGDLLLPRVDLSALLAEPLAAYIRAHGGNIESGNPVTAIKGADAGFMLTSAKSGERWFSHVIIATPPSRLGELLQELPAMTSIRQQADTLGYQPIYTIYLQYPTSVRLQAPMLGFASGYSQWLLDRGQLCGQQGLLAAVISAEGDHQDMPQATLAQAIIKELQQRFPDWPAPLWHKVIAEKRATFSCIAGLQRPAYTTPVPDLYLAGDYVAGDYPATIEGAVRSGTRCAAAIIQNLKGRPA